MNETTHDDGGQAYPHDVGCGPGGFPECEWGMSLLDYFAGQALAGLLANPEKDYAYSDAADFAYRQATAMIAEKRRREQTK